MSDKGNKMRDFDTRKLLTKRKKHIGSTFCKFILLMSVLMPIQAFSQDIISDKFTDASMCRTKTLVSTDPSKSHVIRSHAVFFRNGEINSPPDLLFVVQGSSTNQLKGGHIDLLLTGLDENYRQKETRVSGVYDYSRTTTDGTIFNYVFGEDITDLLLSATAIDFRLMGGSAAIESSINPMLLFKNDVAFCATYEW